MTLEISPARLELLCQESRQSGLLAMEWSFTITALFILSLRLYCRTRFGKGLGWDDYIFGAGAIVGLPDPFFVTKWIHAGLGKHIECLGPARAYATQQWGIAAQAHHIFCLGLVKVSLCLCILRVIDRVERRIATFLWVNIVLVGTVHVAQLAMLLAECRPLNALWDLSVQGSCYSPNTAYMTTYIAFSLDAFTDLVCSGIPIFVIYRTQMNARTKVALCVLMGLGVFTAMCAVAKAITLKTIWSRDFTWNEVIVVKWACVEQALSLILVSLPILRPLFRNFFASSNSDPSPAKIPTIGHRFHRRAAPDYSLLKSTANGNSLGIGGNTSYALLRDESTDQILPQVPLAAYHIEWPLETNVGTEHDDLESGQSASP